jgi:ribosomal protein S18 acetylase RimI-like enzyme
MEIKNCELQDITVIQLLYQAARNLQQEKKMVVWPTFEDEFIAREVQERKQWKLLIDGVIACNWAIAFEDKEIWDLRDKNDAIYIHRICTNPDFRGNRYVEHIVNWSKIHALQMGKAYVRLDTLGNNTKLIEHYTSAGFDFLGIFKLSNTATLPQHYQNEPNCCLFEIAL